ncbi:MAG: response regulator [Crocinitomicaceae bacterium]|nr:response regulator [Crocinitomicaceae bacterium]
MNKILLVEDNETTNFISKILLKNAGIENVDEVHNGVEACEYLKSTCPDIIFLDLNMPIMDGWEFLDEKESKALCNDAKIYLLTSSLHPNDKRKAQNYSCITSYIEKPLTKEKIADIMNEMA